MRRLCIHSDRGEQRVPCAAGTVLRDALLGHAVGLAGTCDGDGTCGRCRVTISPAPPLTPSERLHLSVHDAARGVRLACRVTVTTDLDVTLDTPSPADWRPLVLPTHDRLRPRLTRARRGQSLRRAATRDASALAVAVDLGTTHVRVSLWDLWQGRRLAARIGPNPQAMFGVDVLSRLARAAASPDDAARMADAVVAALGEAIGDLCLAAGSDVSAIERIVIVGNTAMLALLTRHNTDALLDPAHWTQAIDCTPRDPDGWRRAWRLAPATDVLVVPPLAGFVGSDLVAAVLATHLCASPEPALLLDFGTNTEVACWDGNTLHTTSAAGGPAFEGSGVGCGMPAERGAIVRVERATTPPGHLRIDVLGGGDPRGVSGSGLVDAIASFIDAGQLTPAGRFTDPRRGAPLVIAAGASGRDIALSKRDIDVFQRAKAAIGAATRLLLDEAGLREGDVARLCVCGAFGEHLASAHARSIGLLPSIADARIELHGHAALSGAERLLEPGRPVRDLSDIRARARVLNLATAPRYEDAFIAHLALRPAATEETVGC